jgi:hypothetical protein
MMKKGKFGLSLAAVAVMHSALPAAAASVGSAGGGLRAAGRKGRVAEPPALQALLLTIAITLRPWSRIGYSAVLLGCSAGLTPTGRRPRWVRRAPWWETLCISGSSYSRFSP